MKCKLIAVGDFVTTKRGNRRNSGERGNIDNLLEARPNLGTS